MEPECCILTLITLMLTVLFSATSSYMATRLGDGGDLDSMDRSLLDCELSAERFFKIAHSGNEADIVSLDPTKLSLSCDGSLSRLKITSPPPPTPSCPPVAKSVAGNSSSSRNINDPGRNPLCEEKTKTESKIVKFSTDYKTLVLPSSSRPESGSCSSDRNILEQGSSVKTQGEQSFVYLKSTSRRKMSNVGNFSFIFISIF